ncbi:hypothetical protein PG997_006881 [Apiospora hydei]|uniref:TLDc domain-containing protein n=1 Tax=Apiospora hydei TaxID=1337664 RepID=A0ABR1WRW8_9PEZI
MFARVGMVRVRRIQLLKAREEFLEKLQAGIVFYILAQSPTGVFVFFLATHNPVGDFLPATRTPFGVLFLLDQFAAGVFSLHTSSPAGAEDLGAAQLDNQPNRAYSFIDVMNLSWGGQKPVRVCSQVHKPFRELQAFAKACFIESCPATLESQAILPTDVEIVQDGHFCVLEPQELAK